MTKHRIEFVQLVNAFLDLGQRNIHFLGHLLHVRFRAWQEFMQWRIQQSNSYRLAVNCLKDALEIFTLVRQQFRDRLVTILVVVRQNESANIGDPVAFEEHVFRATQPDAFGAKRNRVLGIRW